MCVTDLLDIYLLQQWLSMHVFLEMHWIPHFASRNKSAERRAPSVYFSSSRIIKTLLTTHTRNTRRERETERHPDGREGAREYKTDNFNAETRIASLFVLQIKKTRRDRFAHRSWIETSRDESFLFIILQSGFRSPPQILGLVSPSIFLRQMAEIGRDATCEPRS